jgi:hypothetical protein
VYFIQMMLECWFCHELLDALVETAIDQQIWAGMMGFGSPPAKYRAHSIESHLQHPAGGAGHDFDPLRPNFKGRPDFYVDHGIGDVMVQKTHTVGLAGCVVRLLPFGLVIFIAVQTADAKQCSAALPSSPQGHWSYRLIDGRKCWYEGENNFPKSLLQWPDQTSALSAFGKAVPSRDEELLPLGTQTVGTNAEPNNQSVSDSFEARWRALEMTH